MRVLDAHALLAHLPREPGWELLEKRLREAAKARPLRLCVVNWGRVLYVVARGRGLAQADEVASALERLPIRLDPVDKELARAAALQAQGTPRPPCDLNQERPRTTRRAVEGRHSAAAGISSGRNTRGAVRQASSGLLLSLGGSRL